MKKPWKCCLEGEIKGDIREAFKNYLADFVRPPPLTDKIR